MEKRAQSATEFMIIIGAVLFFFVSFMYALSIQKADDIQEKKDLQVKDIILTVKDEINLASEASDGYSRSFTIPNKIGGYLDYDISLEGNLIYVKTDDGRSAMAYPTLDVTVSGLGIIRGTNTIKKINGIIYLN